MANSSGLLRTVACVRIGASVFFLLFGEYKVAGPEFAYGGFRNYLQDYIANSAVSFYRPVLSSLVLRHAVFFGYFVGVLELIIGISLLLGLCVRPACILGILFLVNMLAELLCLRHLCASVLPSFLELCDLFRCLIAARLYGLGISDRFAPLNVNFAEILQHESWIHPALPKLFFNQGQVVTHEVQIEHGRNYCIEKAQENARCGRLVFRGFALTQFHALYRGTSLYAIASGLLRAIEGFVSGKDHPLDLLVPSSWFSHADADGH